MARTKQTITANFSNGHTISVNSVRPYGYAWIAVRKEDGHTYSGFSSKPIAAVTNTDVVRVDSTYIVGKGSRVVLLRRNRAEMAAERAAKAAKWDFECVTTVVAGA